MSRFAPRLDILPPSQRRLWDELGSVPADFVLYTLTVMVDRAGSVQVSFFGGLSLNRVNDPEFAGESGVRVATLLDLAGTKAGTIYGRLASKDYLDLFAIMESGVTLETILGAGRAVYGPRFNPDLTVRALMYFEGLQGPLLSDHQKRVLLRAANAVQPARIPQFHGRAGLTAADRNP